MKDKFIKIFSPFSLALGLLLASLFGCSDNSQAKRLQNIDEAIKSSRTQLFQDNVEGAIEILQEAYSEYGESLSLCEALAYAYSQAEQYSSSAIYFEKAFRLSKNNLILLLNAGRAYEQCNATDSALAAYAKYLEISPKDANIHKAVAILAEKQNHYQKALNAYMDFLKNAGRSPNTLEACEIAKLFLKLKNVGQSKAWFSSALTACDSSNIELKSEILSGLIDIALSESDMANLEKYQVELKNINKAFLQEKYPKLENEILAYKIKIQEAKQALEESQKREEAKEKKLEEEKLAKEAEEKAQAEKLAKEAKEAEEKAEAEKLAKEAQEKAQAEKLAKEAQENLAQEKAQESSEKEVPPREIVAENIEEKEEIETQEVEAVEAPQEGAKAPQIQEEKAPVVEMQRQAPQRQQASGNEGLVEVSGKSLDTSIYTCIKLIEAEEFSKAENLAQNIVAENPSSSRAWGVLAKAYFAQDMYADAFLAAKQSFAKDKSDLRANLLKAKMAIFVEGEKTLLANLLKLNKDFPECPPVLLALARTYEYIGEGETSKTFYDAFLASTSEKDPLYADALEELSNLGGSKKLDIKTIAKDLEL